MSINITIEDALRSIAYKVKVGITTTGNTAAAWILRDSNDYSTLEWTDLEMPKPTEEEVNAEIERLDKEHNYKDYRSEDYPSINEQLDMLWHSMDKGEIPKSEEFYQKILAVKEKYNKPSMDLVEAQIDILGDGLIFEKNPDKQALTEEDYLKMLEE